MGEIEQAPVLEYKTPEEVFEQLINVDKITTLEGRISFYLGDVSIIVKQKDVVGNIMQEWLEGWLKANNIWFEPNENTQMPPDVYLSEDHTKNLLEVKAYDSAKTPAFDLADFKSYVREIVEKPYMLHVKYLIFSYRMGSDGKVTIKNVWLKNIWEICRSMAAEKTWCVNVQFKNKQIHKIRPAHWSSNRATKFPVFQSLEDYLSALHETILSYSETKDLGNSGWKFKLIQAYEKHYGVRLNIPHWYEIESKYRLAQPVKPS